MDQKEFEAKLSKLPIVDPDDIDKAMLRDAQKLDDGTTISLEEFRSSLEAYSGRLVLRIPKSLHKELKEQADIEGVSLNQYMLYKLSH